MGNHKSLYKCYFPDQNFESKEFKFPIFREGDGNASPFRTPDPFLPAAEVAMAQSN